MDLKNDLTLQGHRVKKESMLGTQLSSVAYLAVGSLYHDLFCVMRSPVQPLRNCGEIRHRWGQTLCYVKGRLGMPSTYQARRSAPHQHFSQSFRICPSPIGN